MLIREPFSNGYPNYFDGSFVFIHHHLSLFSSLPLSSYLHQWLGEYVLYNKSRNKMKYSGEFYSVSGDCKIIHPMKYHRKLEIFIVRLNDKILLRNMI